MNLSKPLRSASRLLHILFLKCRFHLPRQKCSTFSNSTDLAHPGIGSIHVINLDRQSDRWVDMIRELSCILDEDGRPLSERSIRYSAYDAQVTSSEPFDETLVEPLYNLGDQLFVEPQLLVDPDKFDLERPIRMSQAEIAVARSHIGVWKVIAESSETYALVLEDDVWFERGFGAMVERAWREMEEADGEEPKFDILYLSYGEVRHGAPKELLSRSLFRPERGLWFLSGYVLSKQGARALLELLPSRGPIDLWINHKYRDLKVRALRRSVINQRRDLESTNSYSILPTLSKIGILDDGNPALFHRLPTHFPVFAFGPSDSGLSSLAMALSMLGYRCCSDLDDIPKSELERLLSGASDRVFDAYVNIDSLESRIRLLRQKFPRAKYVVMHGIGNSARCRHAALLDDLEGADVLCLQDSNKNNWRALCEHLKLAPPDSQYPLVRDLGVRKLKRTNSVKPSATQSRRLQHDPSPWIVKSFVNWAGVATDAFEGEELLANPRVRYQDTFKMIEPTRWQIRNDTFPGNLGLFRTPNVRFEAGGGLSLVVQEEPLGVRSLSAASISSQASYLYGRFEATLQATDVPGLVSGFFLHRDTPRQEIDVEILGNQPDQLLVNVFYNPGSDGAKFDYGYRGTPAIIKLGFDASKALHQYAIEWDPCEIRWFVDQRLVHRRVMWDPTPVPHLPMALHVNTWPTRSRELAGRLALSLLPANSFLTCVSVDAFVENGLPYDDSSVDTAYGAPSPLRN